MPESHKAEPIPTDEPNHQQLRKHSQKTGSFSSMRHWIYPLAFLCLFAHLPSQVSGVRCLIADQFVNVTEEFYGPIVHLSVDPVTDATFSVALEPDVTRNLTDGVNFLLFDKREFEAMLDGRTCIGKERLAKTIFPLNANRTYCSRTALQILTCHIQIEHEDGPENEIYYGALSNCQEEGEKKRGSARIQLEYSFDIVESPYVEACDTLNPRTIVIGILILVVGIAVMAGIIIYITREI